MKKDTITSVGTALSLITLLLFSTHCNNDQNAVYKRIRNHIDQIKVINTHEHQHWPEEYGDHRFNFYHLLAVSYLRWDVNSAGAHGYNLNLLDTLSNNKLWKMYGEALDYTRNTSFYNQFMKGIQGLYNLSDKSFTEGNIAGISLRIGENYQNYRSWFDNAFNIAGYEVMFIDQYWKQFNTEIDEKYFALVFRINSLISQSSKKPENGIVLTSIYKEADNIGKKIHDLDDYLEFCDFLFKKNIEKKAVCIKNAMAYSRTLFYEDISYEEAKVLFDKSSSNLTPEEAKKIEDFMFHWIIRKSVEYSLPVQIHTGYFAGNGNTLENGHPIKLNNLFLKYPEAKFILFHGGFPWTIEYAALGKMFRNVYLDLVWLPQISREEAVNSLDVMFDCVPYNKFFWGGDCNLIEESVGALEVSKDVVAEVLAKRVKRNLITEEVALEMAEKIFRENAIRVFNLEEKLGRKLY